MYVTVCQISLLNISVSNHHQPYLQLALYRFQLLRPIKASILPLGYSVFGYNLAFSTDTQSGGGPITRKPDCIPQPAVIDLTTLPTERINSFDNVRYPQQVQEQGIVFIASGLKETTPWQPHRKLPIRRSDHPFDRILTDDLFATIKLATQQAPDDVLVYLSSIRAQNVTAHCLRELLSNGEMTRDSILNTFLAILCAEHNLAYLSTFFITILRRDKTWDSLRNWFATDELVADYDSPTMNSARPILIPCHVNGAHWVALVRRIIDQQVHFLYADDLNQSSTEEHLKELLLEHAAPDFYPADAVWMHCKSVTFRPHSNECGPRTLFALTVMALHPNPSPEVLLPYMSPNLAQILRTWIGSVLLSGRSTLPPWATPSTTAVTPALQQQSRPSYLFPWSSASRLCPGSTPPQQRISSTPFQIEEDTHTVKAASSQVPPPILPQPVSMKSVGVSIPKPQPKQSHDAPTERPQQKDVTKKGIQLTLYDALKLPSPEPMTNFDEVWGHFPEAINDRETLRLIFANPQGLKLMSDIMETEYSMGRCHSLGVGVLCLAESNLNWDHPQATGKFHGVLRKVWKHSKVSKSFTKDHFQSTNQPGGTVTVVYNHWTSRVIESGEDPFGLGRWSYQVLRGKGGTKLLIVTAYRVCRQSLHSVGSQTSTAQQFRALSAQFREADREDDPIPRHQFTVDLQGWLEYKTTQGYLIILGIDANEPYDPLEGNFTPVDFQLDKPIPIKGHDGTLATLVRTSGLVDPLLIHHPDRTPPPTYDRGKDKIDFIFVSRALLPHVTRTGIFPYKSLFISDHRPCYIDLDSIQIFQENTPVIEPPQHRSLKMEDPRLVAQYTDTLLAQIRYHKLFNKAETLLKVAENNQWTPAHTLQYEKLDKLFTEAMLKAERTVSKRYSTTYQWSPTLKAAIHTLTYWKLRLSQLKGKIISNHTLQKVFDNTNLDSNSSRPSPLETVIVNIREARAHLKSIQKRHVELRAQHLEDLANAIITLRAPSLLNPGQERAYERKKQKEIRRIQRREALSRMHRKIGYTLHPGTLKGGLSRVDIPNTSSKDPYPMGPDPKTWEGAWTSINDPSELARHVCAANTRQYHQAHHTPCGTEPLATYLGYKGDALGAQHIIAGAELPSSVADQLLPETTSIFSTLTSLAQGNNLTTSPRITPEQFKSCYKAMDKRTSSSPSGRHLGHYKAATLSEELTNLHSIMMSIPLSAGFSPTRWRQIIDVMLEKKPGDHRIHRLRIVALQESDFNQSNRLAIGRPLQHLVEELGLAPDMQHGSRASKLCQSAVLNKQLTFEIHRYQRKPLAYIENDAVGCYDRIINPLVLIFLRILGLSPSIVSSLANTWEQTYHRVRTMYGISAEVYQNTPETPLYGPGQGSTIGPFLWLLCFILIFLSLGREVPGIQLQAVHSAPPITFVGEAFVDDAGLGTNADHNSPQVLASHLQTLAQRWEKLLYSTGGALNLSKCFWFLLSWRWVHGKPVLQTSSTAPATLQMTSEGDPTPVIIPRIEPTSTFRTLGVHISPSGSNKGALKVLQGIVFEYCNIVKGSNLTRQEALMSYIQYLLPKLRFQPPLLSLSQQDCDKLTSQIFMALLPKLHINRHTARSIVFGAEKYGGLALPNLYITQGVDKLKLFLGHLRIQDRTSQLIYIDMSYIQLLTGSGTLFLNQDATSFLWVESGWLQSVWFFTSRYSLQFLYPSSWIPSKPRCHDVFLMDAFRAYSPSVATMRILNRCRLYLQVITLSDIATADGKNILAEAKQGVPLRDRISTLLWPAQGHPSKADWAVWKRYLQYLEDKGRIIQPLGDWLSPTHQRWQYYIDVESGGVYDTFSEEPVCFKPVCRGRSLRSGQWYDTTHSQLCDAFPQDLLPVSIVSRPSTDGSLFQVLLSPTLIPPLQSVAPSPKGSQYYAHLLPAGPEVPYQSLLTGDHLHVCISSKNDKDALTTTSSWMFQSDVVHYTGGHTFREQCTNYRASLRGILTVLYIIYQAETVYPPETFPTIVIQCHSKRALKEAFRVSPLGVTTATQTDYDLILDIRFIRNLLKSTVQSCYALTPSMPQKQPVQESPLLLTSHTSINMDPHQAAADFSPLSHVISVIHHDTVVTGDIRSIIYDLEYSEQLRSKIMKDNTWTPAQFDLIAWADYHAAFRNIPRSHRISIAKLSHQLWNTNCQNNKLYGQLADCPICTTSMETVGHIFRCPHKDAIANRKEAFQTLIASIQESTPSLVLEALASGLTKWTTVSRPTNFQSPTAGSRLPSLQVINTAFAAQTSLGWEALHRGHITHLWKEAYKQHLRPSKPLTHSQLTSATDKWIRLVITSVWIYSEKLWKFRNQVVHGKAENFKVSKAMRLLHDEVRALYDQFERDPFMLPQTRRYLFNRPKETILHLPRESLAAWVRSVKEAILTREHRDKLQAEAAKHTLERFLQPRSVTGKGRPALKASLWKAPFSARYYARHLSSAQRKSGKRLRGRTGRGVCHRAVPTNLSRTSRLKRSFRSGFKPLTAFGFHKVAKVNRCCHDPIGESEYSGTRVSTAP